MTKVKFVRDAEITIDGVLVKYEAGKVYDLREDRAERWKKREAAVDYVEPQPPPPDRDHVRGGAGGAAPKKTEKA